MNMNPDRDDDRVKRVRTGASSKVVLVRDLPQDVAAGELVALARPFGEPEDILILNGRGQAFIQLPSPAATEQMVTYYSGVRPNVRGRPVSFQISKHDTITRSDERHRPVKRQQPEDAEGIEPSKVIFVHFMNTMHEIDVDAVQQLFGRMGRLEKILIFFVSGTEAKALVQFSSVDEASHALRLDGDPMYPGSTLRVMYAKRTSLEVSANGPRSRDFTNPHLPVHERSERTPSHGRGGPAPADYYQAPPAVDRYSDYEYSRADPYRSVDRSMDREVYHRDTAPYESRTASVGGYTGDTSMVYRAPSGVGPTGSPLAYSGQGYYAPRSPSLGPVSASPHSYSHMRGGMDMAGGRYERGYSPQAAGRGYDDRYTAGNTGGPVVRYTRSPSGDAVPYGGGSGGYGGRTRPALMQAPAMTEQIQRSPVVMVSGFDPAITALDNLFKVFGHYGNIARIRIMFKQPDKALVQFMNPANAALAVQYLNGCRLFGKRLRIDASRKMMVTSDNRADSEGSATAAGYFKEYSDTRENRFRRSTEHHSVKNLFPPSAVLHISQLPETVTEADVRELLAAHGPVSEYKLISTGKEKRGGGKGQNSAMALVRLPSIDHAVDALASAHLRLVKGSPVRISFSKHTGAFTNTKPSDSDAAGQAAGAMKKRGRE